MRKFILTLLAVIVGAYVLAACSAPKVEQGQPKQESSESKPSLNGTWTADGFEATVTDNAIEIHIVADESKSLYWKGTFPIGETDKIVSAADVEALSMSIMGSSETEKTFTVLDDNEFIFEFGMMGTTTIVHMKR